MKIGILGTGMVGRALAYKLDQLGHHVMIGTRDVASTMSNDEPGSFGAPSFRAWSDSHADIAIGSMTDAAAHGEAVINATTGMGSLAALNAAGSDNLAGKIVVDVSNPLDFSAGMPPSLSVGNLDSLGEEIQRAHPRALVVKTLNTVTAALMVDPGQLAGADHTMFVCGNDEGAKTEVSRWLGEWFGWKDVIDLGDITNARGTEQFLPLWIRLFGTLGTGDFNVKVVR